MNKEKYCWYCKWMTIDSGWGGTAITPGTPSELRCLKEYWDAFGGGMYSGSPKELKECLEMANSCEDFEWGDWVDKKNRW